jgi:hypothetical protein
MPSHPPRPLLHRREWGDSQTCPDSDYGRHGGRCGSFASREPRRNAFGLKAANGGPRPQRYKYIYQVERESGNARHFRCRTFGLSVNSPGSSNLKLSGVLRQNRLPGILNQSALYQSAVPNREADRSGHHNGGGALCIRGYATFGKFRRANSPARGAIAPS